MENAESPYSINSPKNLDALKKLGAIVGLKNKKKFFLDIKLTAKYQLKLAGIEPDQIRLSDICTASNPTLFHSWRRDKKKAIQWSGIISNS